MAAPSTAIVWFRRDLRLADNPALIAATESGLLVVPIFIHDEESEAPWRSGWASRWWLCRSLQELDRSLRDLGSSLVLRVGSSALELQRLIKESGACEVYWNRSYEPAIVRRDARLKKILMEAGVQARSFNGSLLQSPLKLNSASGSPYRVFTPFWKALRSMPLRPSIPLPTRLSSPKRLPLGLECSELDPSPSGTMGAGLAERWRPGEKAALAELERFACLKTEAYEKTRDFPGADGVSGLSPRLSFGELSPIQIWRRLDPIQREAFVRQLGWREFACHLLFHFPEMPSTPLRSEFLHFPWRPDARMMAAWKAGETGFPLVDAAMRELASTGWIHNRARMVAASFLVKQLLQPWQEGASWYWERLVDADLANNSMGWQWVAGCGADAAPFFRIFNPTTQGERFDTRGFYTRKWLPELAELPDRYLFRPWEAPEEVRAGANLRLGADYPLPIVELGEARERALKAYATLKGLHPPRSGEPRR